MLDILGFQYIQSNNSILREMLRLLYYFPLILMLKNNSVTISTIQEL